MNTTSEFAEFAGKKYLNLETYRKDGRAVRTPVWFAAAEDAAQGAGPQKLYVYTIGESGKVKRIRNNERVRIAPCDMRGGLLGEWVTARAEILTGEEAARGMRLLNRKYVPWKQLLDFFAMFRRRQRIVMAIRPE
ncbi:MAG: PPOX class F420-dependent oxidoreductase [Acidobacteriia bacterium]|nr:PPOX class F420-dependent oxidoreductase [Terriglobia bacterium]